ncbi:hypothetical protein SAMN05892877_101315 [Rhizobium subbaraonis]|uniref:Uncharacterized protein n=1 Tax=Rhizobium subbaraonis TaxID=908946 RepID=A0A285U4A9_9HYPH|nr:hypothetical protein [Rhizobium subbaraonis]SOC35356.1 hypothetical protein SAMN05892877_101315 [Rhizobium subbaraonis]
MFKFFLSHADRAGNEAGGGDAEPGWIRDPLSHPDIAAMDERQRADLPFQGVARTRPLGGKAAQAT